MEPKVTVDRRGCYFYTTTDKDREWDFFVVTECRPSFGI